MFSPLIHFECLSDSFQTFCYLFRQSFLCDLRNNMSRQRLQKPKNGVGNATHILRGKNQWDIGINVKLNVSILTFTQLAPRPVIRSVSCDICLRVFHLCVCPHPNPGQSDHLTWMLKLGPLRPRSMMLTLKNNTPL